MYKTTGSYIKAVSSIVGTTIGVGIFGVPYALVAAGPLLGIAYILGIGALLIILNLLLGEIVLRTRDKKRFVGIARSYIGKKGVLLTTITTVFSFWASLLAYIIVSGQFLHIIFNQFAGLGGSVVFYSVLFFLFGSILILGGLSYISKAESIMVGLLFLTIGVILVSGIPLVTLEHFSGFSKTHFFLPFGVVLFALGSASCIPFVEDILDHNKKAMRNAIITGGLISVLFTLLFAVIVVGVTGPMTSTEAISGLVGVMGNSVVLLGALFGFFALITSYIVIGEHLTNIFRFDYKMPLPISWATATGIPLALYLFATQNFITVIDIAGGVFGSIFSVIVGYIFLKARDSKTREPEYVVKYGVFWSYVMFVVFGLGLIYQLYFTWCQCL